MSRLRVLSVGSSPSSVFLSWRLAASQSCSVSVAWPNVTSKKNNILISSETFGVSGSFSPDKIFDYNNLEVIGELQSDDVSPSSTSVSLINRGTVGGFDVILLSLSSLRQLNKIQKSLQKLIIPEHTVIILDTSRTPPIQDFVRQKFPKNQVCCVICESKIYQIPGGSDCKYVHFSASNRLNRVYFEPPLQGSYELRTSSISRDLVLFLQTSGLDASTLSSQQQFLKLQWQRSIPLIAFEPLSIMLDTPDATKLISSVVARPIYEGLINELLLIAKRQVGEDIGSLNDFINPQLIQSVTPKILNSTSPSFPHSTSIYLYYDFFYQFKVPVDVILLHPILLSDELGLTSSTPYLECVFAFMSQLGGSNDEDNGTSLFQRRDIYNTRTALVPPTISASSSPASSNTGSSNSLLTTAIDSKLTPVPSVTALKTREEALARREQALLAREQAMYSQENNQHPSNRRGSMTYQQQQQHQQHQPTPSLNGSVRQNGQYGQFNVPPPLSRPSLKSSPKRYTEPSIHYNPPTANTNREIDMMNITARRSRRSVGGNHNSDLSLNRIGSSAGYHRMSSPALSTLAGNSNAGPQPFSQQFDLNDALSISGADRYGTVSNKPTATVKRLSSAIFRTGGPKSRSNSITSQAVSTYAFSTQQTNGYSQPPINNPHANGYSPQTSSSSNGSNSSNPYINGIVGTNPYAISNPYSNGATHDVTNGSTNGTLNVHGKETT